MILTVATGVVLVFEVYAIAGVIFGISFLLFRITRIDSRVIGAPWTLRLLLLPGVVVFWPLFARRWIIGAGEPIESNAHRVRARESAR